MPEYLIRNNIVQLTELRKEYSEKVTNVEKLQVAQKMVKLCEDFQKVIYSMDEEYQSKLKKCCDSIVKIVALNYGEQSPELGAVQELITTINSLAPKKEEDFSQSTEIANIIEAKFLGLMNSVIASRIDGTFLARDLFQMRQNIKNVTLTAEEEKKLFNITSHDDKVKNYLKIEKVKDYIRTKLTEKVDTEIDNRYFSGMEDRKEFSLIVDSYKTWIGKSNITGLVEGLKNVDSLKRDSFVTVSMNDDELNLLKNKLKSILIENIEEKIKKLPPQVREIVDAHKKYMANDNLEQLEKRNSVIDGFNLGSFNGVMLIDSELEDLKGALKYYAYNRTNDIRLKLNTKSPNLPVRLEKIENFKKQWLKAHEAMTYTQKMEHINFLDTLKTTSLNGVEMTDEELNILKSDLKSACQKDFEQQKKVEDYIKAEVERISNLPEEKRKEAIDNLSIQTLSTLGLNNNEIKNLKDKIKSQISIPLNPEERNNKIEDFINREVARINALDENDRQLAFDTLDINEDSIEGTKLTVDEISDIKNRIGNQIKFALDPKERLAKIEDFINKEVARINALDENDRQLALDTLNINEDSIEGIKLTANEVADIKNRIRSQIKFTLNPAERKKKIEEFISNEVEKVKELSDKDKIKYLDNLKIEKDAISGIELTAEEINNIKSEITRLADKTIKSGNLYKIRKIFKKAASEAKGFLSSVFGKSKADYETPKPKDLGYPKELYNFVGKTVTDSEGKEFTITSVDMDLGYKTCTVKKKNECILRLSEGGVITSVKGKKPGYAEFDIPKEYLVNNINTLKIKKEYPKEICDFVGKTVVAADGKEIKITEIEFKVGDKKYVATNLKDCEYCIGAGGVIDSVKAQIGDEETELSKEYCQRNINSFKVKNGLDDDLQPEEYPEKICDFVGKTVVAADGKEIKITEIEFKVGDKKYVATNLKDCEYCIGAGGVIDSVKAQIGDEETELSKEYCQRNINSLKIKNVLGNNQQSEYPNEICSFIGKKVADPSGKEMDIRSIEFKIADEKYTAYSYEDCKAYLNAGGVITSVNVYTDGSWMYTKELSKEYCRKNINNLKIIYANKTAEEENQFLEYPTEICNFIGKTVTDASGREVKITKVSFKTLKGVIVATDTDKCLECLQSGGVICSIIAQINGYDDCTLSKKCCHNIIANFKAKNFNADITEYPQEIFQYLGTDIVGADDYDKISVEYAEFVVNGVPAYATNLDELNNILQTMQGTDHFVGIVFKGKYGEEYLTPEKANILLGIIHDPNNKIVLSQRAVAKNSNNQDFANFQDFSNAMAGELGQDFDDAQPTGMRK